MVSVEASSQPEWIRQSTESARSYRAFWDYCELGVGRSLAKLHARYRSQIGAKSGLDKAPTSRLNTLKDWSATFNWAKRAEAFDAHQITLEQEGWERTAREWVRQELADAKAQLARWQEVWDSLPYHEQGAYKRNSTVCRDVPTMMALSKWRREISDQGRRALGLPLRYTEQHLEHKGEIVQTLSWREMVEEERRQGAARARENGQRGPADTPEEDNLPEW